MKSSQSRFSRKFMSRNFVLIALILGLAFTSATSEKDGFERKAESDSSSLRHRGGPSHGGFGFGGHHHQERPDVAELKAFCEKTRAWLNSTAANVTATNGTIPSMQELIVEFLTTVCIDTRSDVSQVAESKAPERHGWGEGWGWGVGHPPKPDGSPLRTFCLKTETWLQTVGLNVTANNNTNSTMQEVFINFLSAICEGETRSVSSVDLEIKDTYTEDRKRHSWHNSPRPKRALEVFCERTNAWLTSSGVNVTTINGTGDNFPTVFIDFLTNICEDTRRIDDPVQNKDISGIRWFQWGPPPQPPNFKCGFGEFCERTNSWLNTTTVNITSSVNGTSSLTATELFVNFLDSIC